MLKKVFSLLVILITVLCANSQMILEFDTNLSDGTTITLPLYGTVDVTVDWGDDTDLENFLTAGKKNHTYSVDGTYTVIITGSLTKFGNGFSGYANSDKLTKVHSFGDLGLISLEGAFKSASNLTQVPEQLPPTVTSLEYMFCLATSFNQDIGNWDVSNVINMDGVFSSAVAFNQNIGNWDVGNVTNTSTMFHDATSFNQDIGNWNVSNVTEMHWMFFKATSFNQDIGNWNVGNVTRTYWMFYQASSFNQDISNWDVSNVKTMYGMFEKATSFNQNIGGWDVSNVQNMSNMFANATSFNKDIGSWNVGQVTTMKEMFEGATSFNQNIGKWNVSMVTDMYRMFRDATSFNQDIGSWNVGNVTNMAGMFVSAFEFNQYIGDWSVTNVVELDWMFFKATSFNQDIGSWDVGNVTSMQHMFREAINFNQNIAEWDVSSVNLMENMFYGAVSFNQDLSSWNISNVTNMKDMFKDIKLSTSFYNNILKEWSVLQLHDSIAFNAGNSRYSSGETTIARQYIIDNYSWTIIDDGVSNLPAIQTDTISEIEFTAARSGGIISEDAGSTVTDRGILWNTSKKPTLTTNLGITSDGSGTGIYSSNLTGLTAGEVYYIRAYATNANGTEYGNQLQFVPQQEINLSGSFSVNNKIYDGKHEAELALNNLTINNTVTGHANVTINNIHLAFNDINVGQNKLVIIKDLELIGADSIKYKVNYSTLPTSEASITRKSLTLINPKIENKIYNGNLDASISIDGLEGVLIIDSVFVLDTIACFNNKNVGDAKPVITKISLAGTDTINYVLTQPTGLTANITKKELTITNAITNNKTYDGANTTTISGATIKGVVSGDDLVIADSTATFENKYVGTSKTITSNITLTGADTINYTLIQPTGLTADITKKELTISNAIVNSKVYDGTTTTTISGATLEGVVTGDDLAIVDSSATFDSKNVGTSKTVTSNITLTGVDTINYLLTQPTNLTADITKKELTITDAVANNKIYDGTTSIEISNASLSGLVTGNDVAFKDTKGTVDDKNVGEAKEVSSAITLSGADTINYYLTQPTGLTVDITPKTITLSGSFTVNNKDFDETTNASIKDSNLVLDGVINPDIVTLSTLVLNFSQADIGNDITVTITEAEISGDDAENYELSLEDAPTTTANILEPVGIYKNNNIELSVYPNPFENQLMVDAHTKISNISITTITGKVINYIDETGLNNINVSQLPQGVYLVNVVLKNNQSKTFKMIKK